MQNGHLRGPLLRKDHARIKLLGLLRSLTVLHIPTSIHKGHKILCSFRSRFAKQANDQHSGIFAVDFYVQVCLQFLDIASGLHQMPIRPSE